MVAVKAFNALSDNGNIIEVITAVSDTVSSYKLGVDGIKAMLYTTVPAGVAVYYDTEVTILLSNTIASITCERTFNSETVNLDPDVSSLKFNM